MGEDNNVTERPLSTLENAIVDGYIVQMRRRDGDLHWSWSVLDELIREAPEYAWPLLLELVARAPDDTIPLLAAGPIEDFLSANGSRVIGLVEAQAARDPRFRFVLRGVWQLMMSDDVWNRVVVASRPDEATEEEYEPRESDDGEAGTSHPPRRVEVVVEGLPPSRPDDPTGTTLVESLLGQELRPKMPIETPVFLELRVRPAATVSHPSADVLIGETIRALVRGGIIADASLVWETRYLRSVEEETHYDLSISEMSEEQVEAHEMPSPDWTGDDLDELLESARAMFPDRNWPDPRT